jgi:hypothetical protein
MSGSPGQVNVIPSRRMVSISASVRLRTIAGGAAGAMTGAGGVSRQTAPVVKLMSQRMRVIIRMPALRIVCLPSGLAWRARYGAPETIIGRAVAGSLA